MQSKMSLGIYSYTKYDHLGRIEEVGEKQQPTGMTTTISRKQDYYKTGSNHTYSDDSATVLAHQVTRTVYDDAGNLGFGVSGSTSISFSGKKDIHLQTGQPYIVL